MYNYVLKYEYQALQTGYSKVLCLSVYLTKTVYSHEKVRRLVAW